MTSFPVPLSRALRFSLLSDALPPADLYLVCVQDDAGSTSGAPGALVPCRLKLVLRLTRTVISRISPHSRLQVQCAVHHARPPGPVERQTDRGAGGERAREKEAYWLRKWPRVSQAGG